MTDSCVEQVSVESEEESQRALRSEFCRVGAARMKVLSGGAGA